MAAAKKKIILPKVMSKLIDIALRDIRKVEKSKKKYILSMDETWYEPDSEITCSTSGGVEIESYTACIVCAAGSVMAFTLKNQLPKGKSSFHPSDIEGNEAQLQAIDWLRQGKVTGAYKELFSGDEFFPSNEWLGYGGPLYDKLEKFDHYISDYEAQDPEPFHKAMKTLQSRLAKAGF